MKINPTSPSPRRTSQLRSLARVASPVSLGASIRSSSLPRTTITRISNTLPQPTGRIVTQKLSTREELKAAIQHDKYSKTTVPPEEGDLEAVKARVKKWRDMLQGRGDGRPPTPPRT